MPQQQPGHVLILPAAPALHEHPRVQPERYVTSDRLRHPGTARSSAGSVDVAPYRRACARWLPAAHPQRRQARAHVLQVRQGGPPPRDVHGRGQLSSLRSARQKPQREEPVRRPRHRSAPLHGPVPVQDDGGRRGADAAAGADGSAEAPTATTRGCAAAAAVDTPTKAAAGPSHLRHRRQHGPQLPPDAARGAPRTPRCTLPQHHTDPAAATDVPHGAGGAPVGAVGDVRSSDPNRRRVAAARAVAAAGLPQQQHQHTTAQPQYDGYLSEQRRDRTDEGRDGLAAAHCPPNPIRREGRGRSAGRQHGGAFDEPRRRCKQFYRNVSIRRHSN
eukprot:PhM_4_TR14140/c3_g1_i1/m.104338